MKKIFILLLLLLLAAPSLAGQTLLVWPQTPRETTIYLVSQGSGEPVYTPHTYVTPPQQPVYPETLIKPIWRTRGFDPYSPDPTQRTELWEDSSGIATWTEIRTALPDMLDARREAIRRAGATAITRIASPYLGPERESWHVQQSEAQALLLNPDAVAPMVRTMALMRGITIEDMVAKIMENVNLFKTAVGYVLGQQQNLLEKIDNAQSYDDFNAVAWPHP